MIDDDFTPRTLGRYALSARIARGGMATVYLARSTSSAGFTKWLALKTIDPAEAAEPGFVQMFLNEARIAARIDHPNVCSVFDFGESDGEYFLVMESLHGEPLHRIANRAWEQGDFPWGIGARVVADAAKGLHAAHELRMADGRSAELVHRDVSPQNVFVLFNGVAKVVDFGIARSNEHAGEKTASGVLKGKIAYMSPEQIRREPLDRRTDVWALGVMLWEVTLGERLFRRDSAYETGEAVLVGEIPTPRSKRPNYPAALESIVMRALERDLTKRYPTAAAMARDIEIAIGRSEAPVTSVDVAEFVQREFASERRAQEARLGIGGSEESAEETRTVEVPLAAPEAVFPAAATGATAEHSVTDLHATASGEPGLTGTASPLVVVIAVLIAAALALVGVLALRQDDRRLARRPTQPAFVPPAPTAPRPTDAATSLDAPADASRDASERDAAVATLPAPRDAGATQDAARVSPPVTAPPRAVPTMAYLNLLAIPSARVFEGATFLGETPMIQHAIRPGRHVLRLVPHNGRPARTLLVVAARGETVRVRFTFE